LRYLLTLALMMRLKSPEWRRIMRKSVIALFGY
jgi:hypothetical protein